MTLQDLCTFCNPDQIVKNDPDIVADFILFRMIYIAPSGVLLPTSTRHTGSARRPSPVSIPEGPARLGRHWPGPPGVTSMRNILFATVAVLGLATAIPAFADQGDGADRADSANSLPPGF